jgi:N-acetyl-gamma-glutamyl-phosphate reductase
MSFSVAIAGASGYAGGELARLLAAHPDFDVVTLAAHSSAGAKVTSVHPHLASFADHVFAETTVNTLAGHDVIALALPHGESGALGEQLRSRGGYTVLLDLGADRRLEDPQDWSEYYGGDFSEPFVYGMPELPRVEGLSQRERVMAATNIAIPGCNATAVTLALAPLIAAGVVEVEDLSAVLAVGASGAGRALRADLLGAELSGNARAYAVGGIHRHLPEIRQNFRHVSGHDTTVSMTPVLVPMSRGILATCSARVRGARDAARLHHIVADAYASEPCIRVYDAGVMPATGDVLGSNTLALGVAYDASVNRVIVVAALDNLVKGTAGAAIQSLNLACGFDETRGLTLDGLAP